MCPVAARCAGRLGRLALALALAIVDADTAPTAFAQRVRAADDAEVDPVGVWHCVLYGADSDQRLYLALAQDGGARMARVTEALEARWLELHGWRRSRAAFELEDKFNRRTFEADLRAPTLGGTWRAPFGGGGWWCAEVEGTAPEDPRPPPARALMQALVPVIMASPSYPRQAIREAKEGRAVSCFIVDGRGEISRPGLIELTDDVFREPTLAAVVRSRYRGRADDDGPVPACRTFEFELHVAG